MSHASQSLPFPTYACQFHANVHGWRTVRSKPLQPNIADNAINILVYAEFDNIIEFTAARNIQRDYT